MPWEVDRSVLCFSIAKKKFFQVSGANLSVCCAPGLLMLGWLIYDIGVLISKKKLNQRAFYPMPAHPSYQRVVIETHKKIKIRKAKNSKEKPTAM